jgi:hypothetical protein
VNNMEQIQAMMEAARNQVARHRAGKPWRPQLFAGQVPLPPDARGRGTLS